MRATELRRIKRESEEADKTTITPSVTAGQMTRFREALIGATLTGGRCAGYRCGSRHGRMVQRGVVSRLSYLSILCRAGYQFFG